jgi:hypothetical protein
MTSQFNLRVQRMHSQKENTAVLLLSGKRFFGSAFLVFCVFTSLAMPAQTLREQLFGKPEDANEPLRWLRTEKSVGLVPEIDFVNGGMGLGLCRGKFIRGTQHAMAGTGYYVSYVYDTDHQISVAGFGGWVGLFRRKFGGQVALKGVYSVNRETQVFGIRPEAGIGFPKMQLNYGYTVYTEKTEMQMPSHSLTLYVYFAIASNRIQMY